MKRVFECKGLLLYFFFFSSRRRHTRSKRDWSSDVCSSDLDGHAGAARGCEGAGDRGRAGHEAGAHALVRAALPAVRRLLRAVAAAAPVDAQEQGDAGGSGGGGALTRSLHDATTLRR